MDKKVLFQAILWSVAAWLLFQTLVVRIWPPQPNVPAEPPTTQPTSRPAGPSSASAAQHEPASRPATTAGVDALSAVGAEEQRSFVLGSVEGGERSPYRAEIRATNQGASLESILLSDYKEVVEADDRYRLVGPVQMGQQTLRSLAIDKILVDNVEHSLDEVLWRGSTEMGLDAQTVTFECDILRDRQPILRLTHRYILAPTPAKTWRYDLKSELTAENLTDQAHEIRVTQHGPVGLKQADRRMDDRAVNAGILVSGHLQPRRATSVAEVAKSAQVKLFAARVGGAPEESRLWWVAAENKYFAFITTPVKPDGGEEPGCVYEAAAVDGDGNPATHDDVATRLVLGPFALSPRDSTTVRMEHYIGPKDKRVFRNERNIDYLRRNYYMLNQDTPTWCTFGWLTELMVTLLNAFHTVVRNYGIAIFLLVLLVRLILHPVTKKTQVNMVKMQQSMGKLQPKLEEVKKRFANDKPRLQQETMRVYKEAGVNPATQILTCLPMMLQMPIWVALYTSLNNNIAMRHQGFLWWIKDLTAPDSLIPFQGSYHLPLIGGMMGEITAFNLLPLLVG
ncbi:MAG: YidC/Oxa1 family insertase periplasmic-domain containing protein, partial [Planctomycetota bacterium]